ncbi:GntR family transcriptional regulator [Mesorhizobium xinjiangense]|uniref:GntR family transcriptional regulator n=1 Tax=Mesorhizobium xinjiangense TaxID=2678685 RepID=UPI0012ED1FE4|nr:GntR family transcriptional regulator [Mesorhizobium xinjiangense]
MQDENGKSAGSRSEQAYMQIKGAVEAGALAPGSRVRENELAERFGISRTPVRDALRRLEAEGLIAHVPHQGAIIAQLDHQAVIELYDMREVLEGTAARYAARHASEAEIQELAELVAAEEGLEEDAAALARLNRVFHGVLYRAGHNRYLLKTLLALRDSMILLGGTTLALSNRPQSARKEHEAIIAAIAARDADAADQAARHHIRNAQRARLKFLRAEIMGEAGLQPRDPLDRRA